MKLTINGNAYDLPDLDPRTSLLDACRNHLGLTGSKKGCDHGQCGACTMLVNGRRINSCLTLAIRHEEDKIETIEGIGTPDQLAPLQQAFLQEDAYQCGYCTPGQICSAKGMLEELKQNWPSHVSTNLQADFAQLSEQAKVQWNDQIEQEIAERMSGNICRCSAYPNIIRAIRQVMQEQLGRSAAETPV